MWLPTSRWSWIACESDSYSTKKKRGPFPATNPCPLVKLSDGLMDRNHSHLPISSYPLERRTRKPVEPKGRRPKCHGIANPVNAALNRPEWVSCISSYRTVHTAQCYSPTNPSRRWERGLIWFFYASCLILIWSVNKMADKDC